MRILHVIQEMRTGGAERVVASLVRGATERGHVVAVAAAPGAVADELGLQPFPLPLLERRPWRIPGGAWRVFRAIRAFRPDVVHAQNPAMAVLVALATGRGRRPASLVSVHGVPEADYRPAAKLLRAAGLPVVACGPGVETGLADAGYRSIETISNAVPPPPAPRDRAELEHELGLPAGGKLVVAAGRLVPVKNHALAIRAIADVPGASLAILGEGPERHRLEELISEIGLTGQVSLPGFVADPIPWYQRASVFILSSHYEGQPNALIEAVLHECPVVCAASRGGTVELMQAAGLEDCVLPGDQFEELFGPRIHYVLALDRSRWTTARERLAKLTDFPTVVGRYLGVCGIHTERRSPTLC